MRKLASIPNPVLFAAFIPLALLALAAAAPARKPSAGQDSRFADRVIEMKGFKFAEYYPPAETQMKTLLEGALAQPQPGGRILVSGVKLQTFRETGEPELVIETPQCVHDPAGREVSSSQTLKVRTAPGDFSIAGEGFLFRQTNSSLFISNRVHTIARGELIEGRGRKPAPDEPAGARPFEVFSDTFDYSASTGLGVYRDNVRVTGTDLSLTGGVLTLKLPIEQHRLESITAERDVMVHYAGMQAAGQRAFYEVENGRLNVTGGPSWQAGDREGRADEFLIDRNERKVQALGNAWLRMAGQSLAGSLLPAFEPSPGTPQSQGTRNVEIKAAQYELQTNVAVFHGGARVTELVGREPVGQMDCAELTAAFSGTNDLQTLTAVGDVVISREDNAFTAGRAVYAATNHLLQLTEDPAWRAGVHQGKGKVIEVNTEENRMRVRGNASLRLPAREVMSTTNSAAPASGPGDLAEIFAEEYEMQRGTAEFRGGVYISHPQAAWTCERLTVQLPLGGGKVERIVADENVVFDFLNEDGQKVHGTGQRAVYEYGVAANRTNETVRLTGNPVVETTNGTFRNSVIIYDRISNKVMAPGRYSVRGLISSLDTNALSLPTRFRK